MIMNEDKSKDRKVLGHIWEMSNTIWLEHRLNVMKA